MLTALALVALVLTTTLAGVHVTGPAIVNPMLRSLEAADYVRLKHVTDALAPKLAKPLMLGSLATTALVTAAAFVVGEPVAGTLFALALAALIGTLVAILQGDLPINRQMAGWRPESPPSDWREGPRASSSSDELAAG